MKNILLGIILLCQFSALVNAQQALSFQDQYESRMSYGRNNLEITEIQGSPYLDKEYQVGTVLTDSNTICKSVLLRYNCADDVLEFKQNNVSYDLIPKTSVKKAEFGGKVFVYKNYESGGGTGKTYFELLVEGKSSLFAHYSTKFYDREPAKGYSEAQPARFDDIEKCFYISVNNSPARKISNNKKLVEILTDKQKEIESFISRQKLSVKKVEDLKKIVSYYNSL